MSPGVLITCEGIDGSGKSTACRSIVAELSASHVDARHRVEPTPTWLGEAVRRGFREKISAWSEALLFMADHATHVDAVRAEMNAGHVVVSDRWSDSTFAYQGAVLARPDFDAVAWLKNTESAFELTPGLTLLFDLDPAVAIARVHQRGEAEKFERVDFLVKVRENYLRLAREEPERFVLIDASKEPETVLAEALRAIVARWPHLAAEQDASTTQNNS